MRRTGRPLTQGTGVSAERRKRAVQRARLRRLAAERDEADMFRRGWPGDGLVPDGSCPCPICRIGTSS